MSTFDPFDPSVREDPYPAYRVLRDQHPAYHNEEREFWALSRFSDVQSAARHWSLFSSRDGVNLDYTGSLAGEGNVVESEPPLHERLRDVIRHPFTPRNVKTMENRVRESTDALLGHFAERGSADLASELALPVPFGVVGDLLGIPSADQAWLREKLETFAARGPGVVAPPPEASAAADEVRQYFLSLAGDGTPRGSELLSSMSDAVKAGRLTRGEFAGLCIVILFAGYEATTSLITNALVLLHEYPAVRAELTQRPELIPAAIEECLRFEAPVQFLMRVTTRATEVHGCPIPEGARVALLFGAANRDDRRFAEPEKFDIHRKPQRHLAFGEGIHFCMGAPLARLEARVVLEQLLMVMPEYEIVGTPDRMWHAIGDRGYRYLPVEFTPRVWRPRSTYE